MRTLLVCLCVMTSLVVAQQPQPDYRNPQVDIERRVADLLGRMTIEEKVAEISGGRKYQILDTTGTFVPEKAEEAFRELRDLNSKFAPRQAAILRNAAQRYLLQKSRLGIPAIFQGEALHGFMANGATSFPQALALASTWDPELVREVFTAAADEMASSGVNQAFTPVLDLARDPRWGRTEETYGEDAFLAARIGVAAIQGLQGLSYHIDHHHVLATAKHFAVHGIPEGGTNTAPGNISERVIRESFLVPFEAAVREANVGSVMASYNEIDGVPSHINPWLLGRVLREEWGFRGYVTGDGAGLQMLYETHRVAAGKEDAARKALAAGVDYDLSNGEVYRTLIEQVHAGKVPMAQLDAAAGRVLTTKFRLGLFENPYVDPDYAQRITNSPAHRELALKAAREAIILLKNDKNTLPLEAAKLKTIAVIGPNAASVHLGGYSREPGHSVSVLEGIQRRAGAGVKVLYAEGVRLSTAKLGWAGWYEDNIKEPDAAEQRKGIEQAAKVARQADVVVLVIGENESTNREAWSESHLGDRDSLDLISMQEDLVKAVVATGKPTVVLLINGRPLSINYVAEQVPAILEGWYLGQEGGTAAAEALFGDINPGGKLPITFPKSVGQLPAYYSRKPSANRSYLFQGRAPLYPFGHGLSYTTFRFENLRVEPAIIANGGTATVKVDVVNTGAREGDEVAQLYVRQRVSSLVRPVMELKGFRRVTLQAGQRTTVEFAVTPAMLEMFDIHMRRVVEPGTFDLMVGSSSAQTTSVTLEVR